MNSVPHSTSPARSRFRKSAVSVFHIEDDPLAADTVARLLRRYDGYVAIGHASTGQDGVERCVALRPRILILDLGLPDMDGYDVAEKLERHSFAPKIILLSVRCDAAFLYRVAKTTTSIVRKSARLHQELKAALDELIAGRRYISPEIVADVARWRSSPQAFFKVLSDREIALLPSFAHAGSDAEIASRFALSPATVQSHRQNVMRKLELHTAAELMRWCAEQGFGHIPRRLVGRSDDLCDRPLAARRFNFKEET